MEMDPQTAQFLRQLKATQQRNQAQIRALADKLNDSVSEHESTKLELDRLRKALKKAAARIRYIEDIPGKRVPYFMQFSIDIPAPTSLTATVAGTRLSDSKQISMDGPFVATTYMGAFLMKTYSLGPYGDQNGGRPNDPPAGSEVITPLTGRWRPVASTADPFTGAYIGAGVGPLTVAGAQAVQTFRPGEVDFLFEIADEGVDRLRQNQISIPSRYLYSEFDRPLYLPVSDFFERGQSIRFSATLQREIGFAEVNYSLLTGGFSEGPGLVPPPDPSIAGQLGRAEVALGGTLYFTMLGYKILQAQSPAV